MKQQQTMLGIPFAAHKRVRVALLGCGGRGLGLLGGLLALGDVDLCGVFDPNPERVKMAVRKVEEAGRPAPVGESADPARLLAQVPLNLVYIASPWDTHVPLAVLTMEHGVHAAVEVPAATTLDECWQLVNTSEQTRRHCIILENCCYGQEEMLMLNLARAGCFGTITHGEGAYIHDLRSLLLSDEGEGRWRRRPHWESNGNFYPTHGFGPIARCMDIHHGDRFVSLVSMSSREAALSEYRDAHAPEGSPKRQERYTAGDMNTSLLKTAHGRTVLLQHDVVTPRPYSRGTLLQGTRGAFQDFPPGVMFDGEGKHEWQPLSTVADYEDPLWREAGELAQRHGGHGGMDFLMTYRLVQCMTQGLPPDLNVYDAAAWSAPGPLSQASVAEGSRLVEFPDFTRGAWETYKSK